MIVQFGVDYLRDLFQKGFKKVTVTTRSIDIVLM